MRCVLFAGLVLFALCSDANAQTFGLGKPYQRSVATSRTFGLLDGFARSQRQETETQSTVVAASPPVVLNLRPVAQQAPMTCENGVCRPATLTTRPRLFRRR